MHRLSAAHALLASLTLVACTNGKPTKATGSASAAPSASAAAPRPSAPSAPKAHPSSSADAKGFSFDAGVNGCHIVYGPAQQPFLGEVTLAPDEDGMRLVTHKDGVATVTRVPFGADAAAPSTSDAGLFTVSSPPCQVAGPFSYCMDGSGVIHRKALDGSGGDAVVARGRAGTSFAVESLDAMHTVIAFLAERKTTEGVVTEAYAVIGEGAPLRVSDEGAGATQVTLAPHGKGLIAFTLDGRVAMTPVHARVLTLKGDKLAQSDDAVVFVGGEAETHTRGALATSGDGGAYGLVPISGENGFGMATVRLDDPPHTDEPVVWSKYLNGLDPAPIAATHGVSPIRIARVRPLEAAPNAPRGLELGHLDDKGAFHSYGLVGSKGRVKSASVAVDRQGFLWLAFTDGAGTWLERRACSEGK